VSSGGQTGGLVGIRPGDGAGTPGTVPDHSSYSFLGAPGRPVWALAADGTGFSAWDTTGVPADRVAGGVSLELADVNGPGEFHAYTLGAAGTPRLLLGTSEQAPSRAVLPAGTRQGGLIWAFSSPGGYEVTFTASVRLAGGGVAEGELGYRVDVPEFDAEVEIAERSGAPQRSSDLQAGGSVPPPASAPRSQILGQNGDADEQVVIADGHVDIGPRFVDDVWTIQVKDDTVSPFVWRDLHDVVLHAVDDSAIEVPEGQFDFLGEPGDTVWLLPQTQVSGILWPGWNTEDSSVVEQISGDTTWRLHSVDGPGEFALFLSGSFGQAEVLFSTQDGLPEEMSVPLRTHAHGNWAFTEPGVYHLELEVAATTTGGEQMSDTRTLAFAVGDVDPSTAFPSGNGNGNGGGNGDGNGGGGGKGGGSNMPKTGVTIAGIGAVAAVLLLAGGALVAYARKANRRTVPGRSAQA
jgi:surface-anchored protein